MIIRNYTGHPITLYNGVIGWRIPSHGQSRLSSKMKRVDTIGDDFPILQISEQHIRDLPEPEDDALIVVSGIVAAAAQRPDVLCPGRVERDENGEVKCAKTLIRLVGM